jgi:hypothetical protein
MTPLGARPGEDLTDLPLRLVPAQRLELGTFLDSNLASAWVEGRFRLFPGKYGEDPVWGDADDLTWADGADAVEALTRRPQEYARCVLPPNAPVGTPGLHGAVWFESVYAPQPDGRTLYALYHNENYPSTLPYDEETGTGYRDADWPPGLHGAGSPQAVPRIGIMRSDDGGVSWTDRGILLDDHDERLVRAPVNVNCTFPGGVGDPCAVPCGDHLYVFSGQYGYPARFEAGTHDPQREASAQCLSVARVPLADLDDPAGGTARRWDGEAFTVPGDQVGVPIAALQIRPEDGGGPVSGNGSFFWGPSVSWNEHLDAWVMVMARVDGPSWVGDSIWISINRHADLGEGAASQDWSPPRLLVRRPGYTLWYPSLQPLATTEDVERRYTTSRLGGRVRLWFKQHGQGIDAYQSEHEIEFRAADAAG